MVVVSLNSAVKPEKDKKFFQRNSYTKKEDFPLKQRTDGHHIYNAYSILEQLHDQRRN